MCAVQVSCLDFVSTLCLIFSRACKSHVIAETMQASLRLDIDSAVASVARSAVSPSLLALHVPQT